MDFPSFNSSRFFHLRMSFGKTNEELSHIAGGKYRAFNAGHLETMKCIDDKTRNGTLQYVLARFAKILYYDLNRHDMWRNKSSICWGECETHWQYYEHTQFRYMLNWLIVSGKIHPSMSKVADKKCQLCCEIGCPYIIGNVRCLTNSERLYFLYVKSLDKKSSYIFYDVLIQRVLMKIKI